jgi:hypothetical protein
MRKQRFTPREVKAAEEVRDLQKKLGYPSTDALVKLLQSGGVVNAPCSSADVYRAEQIYGRSTAMLKGSTVAKKTTSRIPKFEEFDPRISMNQDIYGDIIWVLCSPMAGLLASLTSSIKTRCRNR